MQVMEQVMMAVRRHWFGAEVVPLNGATAVVEPGGQLWTCVDCDEERADQLVAAARRAQAYVVATSLSRPLDLAQRLRQARFRLVQRHGAYVFQPELADQAVPPRRPSPLWHRLWWRSAARPVTVRAISAAELPTWNRVCWRAFGRKGSEAQALREKEAAYRNIGDAGRWYLATVGGIPVGTAMVYQDALAAQVLAVGTLPSFRGRGVATALLRHLIREWREYGHGFLFLDTTPGGAAERLYCKHGFVAAYVREVYAPCP
jgi:GNAT superfamily N-acetyltransferase